MKQISLSEMKDNLPRFLREASSEQIVITRHGRPAGVLVGFASEDEWLDYRLEHDPGFLDRIASARASIQAGRGVRIEDLDAALNQSEAPGHAPQRTDAAVTPAASAPPPSRPPRSGRASRARRRVES
jgi:prevent-host-death family protein